VSEGGIVYDIFLATKKQALDHGLALAAFLARRSRLERISYDIEKAHHTLTTNGVSVILFSTSQSHAGKV